MQDQDAAIRSKALSTIDAMFTLVEQTLARTGQPFLGGASLGVGDIMFASHASWLLFPPEFGAGICTRFPTPDDLPPKFRAEAHAYRSRPAGQHAMRLYREHRDFGERRVTVAPTPEAGAALAIGLMAPRSRV